MTTRRSRKNPNKPTATQLDPRVIDLMRRLMLALEPAKIEYAIGGAVAMYAHGYRRHTSDVDAFIADSVRIKAIRLVREQGLEIMPVFPPHHYAAYDPKHGDPEIRIDLMFPADEPELSAIDFPDRKTIGGMKRNVFPSALLVIAKFYANRAKDKFDIAAMLEVGAFDADEVVRILSGYDPDLVPEFREFMRSITEPTAPRKRPDRKPR